MDVSILDDLVMCGLQDFLKLTYIDDEEEPAGVDEYDEAGDHGHQPPDEYYTRYNIHQPPGGHAEHPGEEGGQGAVAQSGTKTS